MTEPKRRVLVTGGLGFIGSNLMCELERRGHEVWACDLMHSEKPNYIRCDVSKYRQVERMFSEHDFDYVYHAAAEYGRWNGEDYYENLWPTNAVGTKNILRLQEKKRFCMIFFGSAEVYGDYDGLMSEDVMDKIPIKQMNDYAITKWVNELTGNDSGIVYKQRRNWAKKTRLLASIEKAKKILGYEHTMDFKEGLKNVHNWFLKNFENIQESVEFQKCLTK